MKRLQATKILDKIMSQFGQELATIRFESSFAVDTFREAHTILSTKQQKRQSLGIMWTAIAGLDITLSPPRVVTIGGKSAQDEELIEALIDNLNNQCLWLLVSAYETFEKYYKSYYGALGYLDRSLWTCSDFGNVRLKDLRYKNVEWYQQRVRETIGKHNINEIIKNIRKTFPVFSSREADPYYNLNIWIPAIAYFRHVIVHNHGIVKKDDLIPDLEKVTGWSFTSTKKDVRIRLALIRQYFISQDSFYQLQLADRNTMKPPYRSVEKLLFSLINKLTNHAILSYKIGCKHFECEPFWERKMQRTSK